MCCEQLVCASCAGPVSEGRCPTCRSARAELHRRHGDWQSYAIPVAIAVLLVLYLVVVLHGRTV